jgi:type 2 lantibiotic biosynthesis protein LanM
MYLVGGTDVHYENIIARGEHPHLIDLESVFTPRLRAKKQRSASENDSLLDTVLSVGVLPRAGEGWEDRPGVDTSAIGGRSGQLFPRRAGGLAKSGTDEMHMTEADRVTDRRQNLPYEETSVFDAHDFLGSFESGLERMYDLVSAQKDHLKSAKGLPLFANDRVRVILKATAKYARLLGEATHPEALRDGMDRELLMDVLWKRPSSRPWQEVVKAEIRDLTNGDIPAFWSRPSASLLLDSAGRPIGQLIEETGLERASKRIDQLSADDKKLQVWCVRAAFATMKSRHVDVEPCDAGGVPDHGVLNAIAVSLGNRLCETAHTTPRGLRWTTLRSQPRRPLTPAWAGLDLYDGMPGILLFLARLGLETTNERVQSTARDLGKQLLRAPQSRFSKMSAGAFTGVGGVIYVLSHLGSIWRDSAYLDKAESLVGVLRRAIERDRSFDLMNGSAGAIMGLRALHALTNSAAAVSAVEAAARHLMSTSIEAGPGRGWVLPGDERPIGGMSHGASGIAMALAAAWRVTGDDQIRSQAIAACDFEDSLYLPRWANWADLRGVTREQAEKLPHRGMMAWCHGAPGIGLARLRLATLLDEPRLLEAARMALQSAAAVGLDDESHCLCHGAFGNIEFTHRAGALFRLSYIEDATQVALRRVSTELTGKSPVCGYRTAKPFSVPGLMVGLAGIGYACLRHASRGTSPPSVLTLDLPGQED